MRIIKKTKAPKTNINGSSAAWDDRTRILEFVNMRVLPIKIETPTFVQKRLDWGYKRSLT